MSEPASGQVKAILRTGEIVLAAEAGTFVNPRGLAVTENGKVVVASSDRTARELVYAEPRIASISPDQMSNKGGQTITINGSNFAPDTLVAVSGIVISQLNIVNTQTITFTTPPLPSGRGTLTIQNRGVWLRNQCWSMLSRSANCLPDTLQLWRAGAPMPAKEPWRRHHPCGLLQSPLIRTEMFLSQTN